MAASNFGNIFPKSVKFLQELIDGREYNITALGQEIWQDTQEALAEDRMYYFKPGGLYSEETDAAFAVFKTKWENIHGEEVWAIYQRDKNNPEGWFGPFFHERTECLRQTGVYTIGDIGFPSRDHMEAFLREVKEKAMEEDWSYGGSSARQSKLEFPILKTYLEHYYYKQLKHNPSHVKKSEDKMIFNTGLVDDYMQDIFIQCDINKTDPVRLYRNPEVICANQRERYPDFRRDDIKLAEFFTDINQVIFDPKHIDKIELNWEHIFEHNQSPERRDQRRLPDRYYEMSETEFSSALKAAIEESKVLILRNYKLLVPQYWKKTDDIQFLMPLFLERDSSKHPVCTTALVLQRMGSGDNIWYKGETVLNLAMAYNNARLIAKPDGFWLNPAQINDTVAVE